MLRLGLLRGVKKIGFADDVILTRTDETLEEVEMLTVEMIDIEETWKSSVKLQLTRCKTEVVMVSDCKTVEQFKISVGVIHRNMH